MIVVVDSGLGNVGSVANMLKKIGAPAVLSADPATIETADRLILPGVGAFDQGMRSLEERGLLPVLTRKVLHDRAPTLGLCLGMQLLARRSDEGVLPGLGWVNAEVVRFRFEAGAERMRVPHMGWNTARATSTHPLLRGMDAEPRFYFAHSYHLVGLHPRSVVAETRYGYDFVSILAEGNVAGVQFHPEKSHRFGMSLLENFAAWAPTPAGPTPAAVSG